jgi:phosphoserine phosphatase RsbU/P
MADEDDDLALFADGEDGMPTAAPWKILIVDDEPQVHDVTRLALRGLQFRGRALQFLDAHSAAEARGLLARHPDLALVLLDVVMETDDAGLQLVRHIRERLGYRALRIVLRTGQAGQAPERQVVLDYDIDDYKEKTELTSAKLTTCVVAALRAFEAIDTVSRMNAELERLVAERTAALQRSLASLEQGERAGRRLQFALLPPRQLRFGRLQVSHLLLPSEFLSGDFVDVLDLADGRVLFYLADVAGHGVASAFVTVWVKRFFGAAVEHARQGGPALADPAALLGQLNAELLRDGLARHVALFLGVLDTREQTLCYASAGAFPPPLLFDGRTRTALDQPGTPLGLLEEAAYASLRITLPPRYRLLLVSDGALEVLEGSQAERLARLASLLDAGIDHADALAVALGCSAETPLPDDLAVLLLGYDGA